MGATFHIGELAARSKRNVHTIRWYESQGLVPGVRRDDGGRRVYEELHVGWLDLVDRLRRTGMSIAQMRAYVALVKQGRSTLQARQELLSTHRARIKTMMAEFAMALKLIDGKIDFYEKWLLRGRRPKMPGSKSRPNSTLKRTRQQRRAA
jgi:DNA-binding transcriptional MerR regulator